MLKLYGGARSRASIVQWYLEELAIPYEFVLLDMQAGEHRQPEFLKINPVGKVPAIVDGEFQLWETGAILLYLAEKYGELVNLEMRSLANQWILFANATFGPGVFVEANREKEMPRYLSFLETLLSQQTFIMGDQFTVADIAVGSMMGYMVMMIKPDISEYKAVSAYLGAIAQRPAFQKSIGAG
jgi:glutathione S-transferase